MGQVDCSGLSVADMLGYIALGRYILVERLGKVYWDQLAGADMLGWLVVIYLSK